MMKHSILIAIISWSFVFLLTGATDKAPTYLDSVGAWSKEKDGFRVRLMLKSGGAVDGTKLIRAYLEIENKSKDSSFRKILIDPSDLEFRLLDDNATPIAESFLPRSGLAKSWPELSLPVDSSLTLGLHSSSVAIPDNNHMLLATPTADWALRKTNAGTVHLRATLRVTELLKEEAKPIVLTTGECKLRVSE